MIKQQDHSYHPSSINSIFNRPSSKVCIPIAKPNLTPTKIPFGPMSKSHPCIPKGPPKLFGMNRSAIPSISKSIIDIKEVQNEARKTLDSNLSAISDLILQVKMTRGRYIPDYMIKTKKTVISEISASGEVENFSEMASNEKSDEIMLNQLPVFKLYQLLNQPNLIPYLNDSIILSLIDMIKKNLLLPVPEVPKQYIYCDLIAQLTLENWEEFEILHKIIFKLIHEVENPLFTNFLRSDFVRTLLSILNSPDHNEQSSIEAMITSIIEKFPETIEKVYNDSISRIVHHVHDDVEDRTTYFCVSSCLKFILSYFKQPVSTITSPEIFQYKIFPLFSSYFLSEFYTNLNVICSMFYGLFDGLSSSSLRYLLSHWPDTHTSKQIVYICHVAVIVQNSSTEKLSTFLPQMLKRILKCLHSSNFKIILCTLQKLSRPSLMFQLAPFSEMVITELYPTLVYLEDYWHPDVSRKIDIVIDLLSQINPGFFKKFVQSCRKEDFLKENVIKEEKISQKWEIVANAAQDSVSSDVMKNFNKKFNELKYIDQIEIQIELKENENVPENDENDENNPESDENNPENDESNPESDENNHESDESNPENDESNPDSDENNPENDESNPENDENNPENDESNPENDENNPESDENN